MKKKRMFILILIILWASALIPVMGAINGPYANTDYGTEDWFAGGGGRHEVVANDLIWVFGVADNTGGDADAFGYWYASTSLPGTFSSFQTIRNIAENGNNVAVDTNGTHLAYVAIEDGYDKVLYRLGTLDADGGITWSAVEQTIKSGAEETVAYPAIVFDHEDRVWIGFCQSPWTTGTSVLYTTDTMDGTWSTRAGYPEWGNGGDYHEWHTTMAATQDENGNVIIFSLQTTSDHSGLLNYLIAHNGTDTDNDAFLMPSAQWENAVEIVADPDSPNRAFMAYMDTSYAIYAMTFTGWIPGIAGEDQQWTTPELIESGLLTGYGITHPTLSIDSLGNGVLIYPTNRKQINYAICEAGQTAWAGASPFYTDAVNMAHMRFQTSTRYAWDNKVWYIKGRDASSPYSYALFYMDTPGYSIANVTSMDADTFEWGSSWGDSAFWYTDNPWVFEGKRRYSFTITYENASLGTVEQVGVRFTDAVDDTHTILYNIDAKTLTVTSPGDGISGWIESFSQVNSTMTATFKIMFNSPIPDSYDVQLEMRVVATGDTGWETPIGGIFNIYNLGGYSTLYDTGKAGRIDGGDIFEIYAADTRTKNLVPLEDFNVRTSPLPVGWQIGDVWITLPEDEGKLRDDMADWKWFVPNSGPNHTANPTARLPYGTTNTTATPYAQGSYPFSLRVYDNPRSTDRFYFAEKEFFRTIVDAHNELVYVQVFCMTPEDSGTGGRFYVSDIGLWPEYAEGGDSALIAADIKFSGYGLILAADGNTMKSIANYNGFQWYNITLVMDTVSDTYDVYVDDVLAADDYDFKENTASDLGFLTLSQDKFILEGNYSDMYYDDVKVWTNFTADYGGISEATMLFDMNQHWSMDFDFFVENGQVFAQGPSVTPFVAVDDYSDLGYVELGWDVMIDKTLVHDFIVARINITDGQITGKNDWVQFNVTWYANGTYVKNDLLYGLFEGYSLFPGSGKDTCGFHWDVWFNRANASTVVGARVNTEYYGMSDKAIWWAVWSSNWTPMRSEVAESTIFVNLRDNPGAIHPANDVSFVRSWVKVLRNSEAQFAYKVLNIAGLDFLIAVDTMSGIDTPPIRETLVPDVMSGFFGSALGGIFSAALKRLGNTLAGFGMGFFTLSIDFIDNIFAALGYPALVTTIFTWMSSLFANVPTLLGYGLTLIDTIFDAITISASNTLTQLASIVTIWVGMYSTVMDMLNGVLTPGIDLWNDLGVSNFIRIGAVLYPMWLLLLAMDQGLQAVFDHLNGVLNIGSFFLNFILNVAGFFISLLTGLIGAIRG